MVYEVRDWFGDRKCLYTDDPQVKDIALKSRNLAIAAAYFRTLHESQAFAWDIVGRPDALAGVVTDCRRRRSRRRNDRTVAETT